MRDCIEMAETFPDEDILIAQKERQAANLRSQAEHFTFWQEEEQQYLSKVFADDNFVIKGYTYEKWQQADFAPGNEEVGPRIGER